MPKPPSISDAEWRVMQVLWDRSPLTAAEVVDRLSAETWSPVTIKTMLNRLVKKGALKFRRDGKRYLYSPAVSRDAAVRQEVTSLRDRIFNGAASAMLAYLVNNQKLSQQQIKELKSILDDKE